MTEYPQLTVTEYTGKSISAVIPDLARLRITVFREFPYLYDGCEVYEKTYLKSYLKSDLSYVVTVADGDRIIGASTAMPLAEEDDSIRNPYVDRGFEVDRLFYFGESVLLPEWRGRGIGSIFMRGRLQHARRNGFERATFCAVVRPEDHPGRPSGYQPLDAFWQRYGFSRIPGFVFSFSWRELGEEAESPKPMQVWMGDTEPRSLPERAR